MLLTPNRLAATLLSICLFSLPLPGQPNRLTTASDLRARVTLTGDRPPQVSALDDLGAVDPGLEMAGITVQFQRSAAQQQGLRQLLEEQQNPASPNYRRWLTPEQFADRFGVSQQDISQFSAWLRSQGLRVDRVARSRMFLICHGTARSVRSAFQTEIRRYRSGGGQTHFANSQEPSLPAAFAPLVSGIEGLDDFLPQHDALRSLLSPLNNQTNGRHYISPDDLATIYDFAPLHRVGIDGSGQKIAIVGQTSIALSDILSFRSRFNLPGSDPQVVLVPNVTDPGRVASSLAEADIDLEWSMAAAPNASIIYVYSRSAFTAMQYAIDQNLAPVVSASFNFGCEYQYRANIPFYQALAQQANAQGITWVNASGDAGAASCDANGSNLAQNGLAVRFPAVLPEVTAVGGTEFDDQNGSYWSGSNNANGGSALSYIPEIAWNTSALRSSLASTGGGASRFFPKPLWQSGPGVPADGMRDIPDVSMSASPDHVGYLVYSNGALGAYGGTSVAAPVIAGTVALLNQYLLSNGVLQKPGLGNINPTLYRIAQTRGGVFHDVLSGSNRVPCAAGTPDCQDGSFGYDAGPGYDLVTGLGSVSAVNLVQQWASAPAVNSAVVASISSNPVYQQTADADGYSWFYKLTLKEEAGIATTLTGFTIDGGDLSSQIPSLFGSATIPANGSVTANIRSRNLTPPVVRSYRFSGVDADNRSWSTSLTVTFQGAQVPAKISGVANAASFQTSYAPGMILSVFGSQLSTGTQAAGSLPLPRYMMGATAAINGVTAPLYYSSPGQLNVQIPYETVPGAATLQISNGESTSSFNFTVEASAPGIFTANGALVPSSEAKRGQVAILFITGEGAVSPALATGATPGAGTAIADLPKPRLPLTVTVGGVSASVVFAGIPSGLAGATQVNFQVPGNAPLGAQPVVVTVGDKASNAATLMVGQ